MDLLQLAGTPGCADLLNSCIGGDPQPEKLHAQDVLKYLLIVYSVKKEILICNFLSHFTKATLNYDFGENESKQQPQMH